MRPKPKIDLNPRKRFARGEFCTSSAEDWQRAKFSQAVRRPDLCGPHQDFQSHDGSSIINPVARRFHLLPFHRAPNQELAVMLQYFMDNWRTLTAGVISSLIAFGITELVKIIGRHLKGLIAVLVEISNLLGMLIWRIVTSAKLVSDNLRPIRVRRGLALITSVLCLCAALTGYIQDLPLPIVGALPGQSPVASFPIFSPAISPSTISIAEPSVPVNPIASVS